jgi:uncharacterized SAM-binding protein YcdF (DUF218 family)
VFLAKKIIALFFKPLTIWLILTLIAFYYIYKNDFKKTKLFFILSTIWILLISSTNLANTMLLPLEYKYSYLKTAPKDTKYILVLGSGHRSDINKPINSQVSRTALVRLSEGIRLLNQLKRKNKNIKLILSGYAGYDGKEKISHAVMQRRLAISLGVDKRDIIIQTKPRDTKEEAINVAKIIGKSKLILVTSASHIPRAMEIFRSVGLKPTPAPTNYLYQNNMDYITMPRGKTIENMTIVSHEYLGIAWNWLVMSFKKL